MIKLDEIYQEVRSSLREELKREPTRDEIANAIRLAWQAVVRVNKALGQPEEKIHASVC